MKSFRALILGSLLSMSQVACTAASYVSQEALSGTAMGSLAGAGVGWLIGNEVGMKTENVAVNAAIGGGLGLLAGAIINEKNVSIARQREVVMREARLVSKNQQELDRLRENLYDSTSWGRGETKPWNERYLEEDPARPYQGPSGYYPAY